LHSIFIYLFAYFIYYVLSFVLCIMMQEEIVL